MLMRACAHAYTCEHIERKKRFSPKIQRNLFRNKFCEEMIYYYKRSRNVCEAETSFILHNEHRMKFNLIFNDTKRHQMIVNGNNN